VLGFRCRFPEADESVVRDLLPVLGALHLECEMSGEWRCGGGEGGVYWFQITVSDTVCMIDARQVRDHMLSICLQSTSPHLHANTYPGLDAHAASCAAPWAMDTQALALQYASPVPYGVKMPDKMPQLVSLQALGVLRS
jgi:hypothetical protein